MRTLEDVVCDGGTPVAQCMCGLTHFGDGDCMEEGEHERLIERSKAEPSRFRSHPDMQGISTGVFAGRIYVWGCECNLMAKYEAFLLENERMIVRFLRARAEDEKQDAAQRLAQLTKETKEESQSNAD